MRPREACYAAFALGVTVVIAVACSQGATQTDGGTDASAEACTGFCNSDASTGIDPFGDASYALRTRALFSTTCAGGPESGCHFEHAENLSLTLDPDGGDVINVPSTEIPSVLRVVPFDAGESYVYWKVTGDPRIDGGQMPLGAQFDPRIPELLGSWIEAGAP